MSHDRNRHRQLPGLPSADASSSRRLDALARAVTQQYPIKASALFREAGIACEDPLSADIAAAGPTLPETVLPMLQTPFSIDSSSILNPSRRMIEMRPTLPPLSSMPEVNRYCSPPLLKAPPAPTLREPGAPGPAFQTTFQFVANEDAKEARKTIRAHVMREYRRRERFEGAHNPRTPRARMPAAPTAQKRRRKLSSSPSRLAPDLPTDCPPAALLAPTADYKPEDLGDSVMERSDRNPGLGPISDQGVLLLRPKFDDDDGVLDEPTDEKDLPYRADPWAAVARSQVDPFSRVNFDCGPSTQAILHHYAWVMPCIMDEMVAGTCFHRLGWLYSAVSVHDPTPAPLILGLVLKHLANCHGLEEPPLAMENKAKALQLINERMEDPVRSLSEEAIGSVVNIAALELVDSNPQGFALHMTALRGMIAGRGGMASLCDNIDLENVILRLDVLRAYIAISYPRYPTYSSVRNILPIAINVPRREHHPPPSYIFASHRAAVYGFCEDALALIHELEDTLLLIRSASDTPLAPKSTQPVRELLSSAIAQLLRDPGSTSPVTGPACSRTARKCLRLATLVFLDIAMHESFSTPARPGTFARALKTRFLRTPAPWGRSLEMLLSVLLQTTRMALEKPWRAWYFADVATLTMALGEPTWRAVEAALEGYLRERCAVGRASVGPGAVWDLREAAERAAEEWE